MRQGRGSGVWGKRRQVVAVGLTIVCAALVSVTLGGCSIPVADLPGIGVPGNAPARTENQPAYLPVHDVPPPRDEAVLSADEQKKIQTDLLNARDKQNAQASALVKGTNTASGAGK